ncbi:IS200/IS605 family transposase, partial [Ligilactobacillus salivarius]
VFVTKYRRKIFDTQEKVNTMKAILQRQATISEVTISQLEVMPDHVHMLISFKPKYAPSNIVKNLKGASA